MSTPAVPPADVRISDLRDPHIVESRGVVRTARALSLLLLGSLIVWAGIGPEILSNTLNRPIMVSLVISFGIAAFWLGDYSRHRVTAVERAYSLHLEQLSERLRTLAYRDSLTGLYNHRYFYEQLTHELEAARRYGTSVSIAMLDMDNFKEINDTSGHMMGDRLLALVGETIGGNVRSADIPARYGGDEFVVILPATDAAQADAAAAKLTAAIAGGSESRDAARLTASYGIATYPEDGQHILDLLQAADRRLYQHKARPRRRPAGADDPASLCPAGGDARL